ncbi:MAG: radical SAM protein [Lachnospiraceae bacterium]|nr:radical SAM protein [Lachnospiraceae bacterium]
MEKETLVSYLNLPFGLKKKGLYDVIPLTESRFMELKASGLSHVSYENRYVPRIYLEITKRCNLNCMHCFASAGSNCSEELSLNQIEKIIDDASEAGVLGFVLTGGEPLIHPDFQRILKLIHEKGMEIMEINTNGMLLDSKVLDTLKELDEKPSIKISLDGIGIHDKFRNCKGAEKAAKGAFELSVESGFRTYAQIQINKITLPYIKNTLLYLDSIGVYSARLIRTSESKRWVESQIKQDLTFGEYYAECLDITDFYLKEDHKMQLDFWNFLSVNPQAEKQIYMPMYVRENLDLKSPICENIAKTLAIDASGNVFPCLEISSVINEGDFEKPNVLHTNIKDILKDTSCDLNKFMMHTVSERRDFNKAACGECNYRDKCTGGCPGLALIGRDRDFLGIDDSVCTFFKEGYYEKLLMI